MRYGYWLPVFGGWLRNVGDERMEATWEYVSNLAIRSEDLGYDLTLIAELNLNDIKGVDAPALDAWSTAAALAALTERLELMVAVRPTFHQPALLAKQAANIDHISGGRLSLNVVSSRRERYELPPLKFGVAAYSIVRDSVREAHRELDRITDIRQSAAGCANFQQWLAGTQLEQRLTLEDYSVSNRGLRSGLVGTPEQVAERVAEFEDAGVDLLLLQCSPQLEEME